MDRATALQLAQAVADDREIVDVADREDALRVLRKAKRMSRLDALPREDGTWRIGLEGSL